MRWTPDKVDKLRELAPTGLGSAGIAAIVGTTPAAVRRQAFHLGRIPIKKPRRPGFLSLDEHLRARWREMLPAMRAALRDEIERM